MATDYTECNAIGSYNSTGIEMIFRKTVDGQFFTPDSMAVPTPDAWKDATQADINAMLDAAVTPPTPPPPDAGSPVPPDPNSPPGQAGALMAGTVTVTCASLPALNGDYPIDTATRQAMTAVRSSINSGHGLPGGGDTFNWPDDAGGAHDWPATQFLSFASQVTDFVYACNQVIAGFSTTLPSNQLSIE